MEREGTDQVVLSGPECGLPLLRVDHLYGLGEKLQSLILISWLGTLPQQLTARQMNTSHLVAFPGCCEELLGAVQHLQPSIPLATLKAQEGPTSPEIRPAKDESLEQEEVVAGQESITVDARRPGVGPFRCLVLGVGSASGAGNLSAEGTQDRNLPAVDDHWPDIALRIGLTYNGQPEQQ